MLQLHAAEVCAMPEKKQWLKETIDWARRIHWIWTLVPDSSMAFWVCGFVAGIAALNAASKLSTNKLFSEQHGERSGGAIQSAPLPKETNGYHDDHDHH